MYEKRQHGKHLHPKSKCEIKSLLITIYNLLIFSTQKEKRMREEARREEERLRQHAHAMSMNIMRARVGSAQLLLEGRSLSAKS